MNIGFTNNFRSIHDLSKLDALGSPENDLSIDPLGQTPEIIRKTETPGSEEMSLRSLSYSPATTHLDSLGDNPEINQIKKVLDLINRLYQSDLLIPIDPYRPTTWMDLFTDPEHTGSRLRSHHRNVCFCFLFAVALDDSLESADKIRTVQETLSNLALEYSFDVYNSLLQLPPIMVVFILPYILEDFKNSVLENASNPNLTLSWISVIFEHSATWPESTQKTILKSLNAESFPFTRAFRIHTSADFKYWFFLISRASNPAPLHLSETVESFRSFISTIKPNVPLQHREDAVAASLLKLSPAAAIDSLARSSADIQAQAFNRISDLETLTFWVEAAFEYKESIGRNVLTLIAHHADPSFLPYFHRTADREVQIWAKSVEPVFFRISSGHGSCRCVVS